MDQGIATVFASAIAAGTTIIGAIIGRSQQSGTRPRSPSSKAWQWLSWIFVTISLGMLLASLYLVWSGRLPGTKAPMAANIIEHSDFTGSTDGWEVLTRCNENWSNCQSIKNAAQSPSHPIDRGVAYEIQLEAGAWVDSMVRYAKPVQADVVTAQFYVPESPDLTNNWVGLSALGENKEWIAGSYTRIEPGVWTTVVLDLRDQYDSNSAPLNGRPLFFQAEFSVQGQAGIAPKTVKVGLDDAVWYAKSGVAKFREQPGPGRTIFDFENRLIGDWHVSSQRSATDTLQFTEKSTYRGRGALALHTRLGVGEKSFINTIWHGTKPPRGGWVAKIYLPPTSSTTTEVWANLVTDTKEGWKGSEAQFLRPGRWTTLIWDTRDLDWTGKEISIGIQIGAEGDSYQGPIYVDDVQVFEE